MKIEITEFRGVKFGEVSDSTIIRPLHTDPDGVLWCDKNEDQKVGVVRVSKIMYGFYKGKFMIGKVKFGGEETYIVLLTALTEKYKSPFLDKSGWKIGNVEINLRFNPEAQVDEGVLTYEFLPLTTELKVDLDKKKTAELKMKVNAAKGDL